MAFRSAGLSITQIVNEITEGDATTIVQKGIVDTYIGGGADVFQTGQWFGPLKPTSAGPWSASGGKPTQNQAGRFNALLVPIPKRIRFDRMMVGEHNGTGTIRFGVYADDGNMRGTGPPLTDEFISGTESGVAIRIEKAITPFTLNPGLYWWSSLLDTLIGGAAGFTLMSAPSYGGEHRGWRNDISNVYLSAWAAYAAGSIATGVMPDPWPASANLIEASDSFIMPVLRIAAIGPDA